jgi:hypothetical protein
MLEVVVVLRLAMLEVVVVLRLEMVVVAVVVLRSPMLEVVVVLRLAMRKIMRTFLLVVRSRLVRLLIMVYCLRCRIGRDSVDGAIHRPIALKLILLLTPSCWLLYFGDIGIMSTLLTLLYVSVLFHHDSITTFSPYLFKLYVSFFIKILLKVNIVLCSFLLNNSFFYVNNNEKVA